MDEKETIKLSRSFARKVNMGNYESVDFYSSRSQEITADSDLVQQYQLSRELQALAIADVEQAISEYLALKQGVGTDLLVEMIDSFSSKKNMLIADHDKLNPDENKILQAVKRAVARTKNQLAKEVQSDRDLAT